MARPLTIADRLGYVHQMPDSRPNADSVETSFNTADKSVATITGLRVVFDEASTTNTLFSTFHTDGDAFKLTETTTRPPFRDLTIICDTLKICSRLRLPECNVTIYARQLEFTENGFLDTSPMPWATPKAADCNPSSRTPGSNGGDGHHGGNITAYVGEVIAPGRRKRLILRGGDGQRGGEGKNGAAGRSENLLYNAGYTLKRSYKLWPFGVTEVTHVLAKPVLGAKIIWHDCYIERESWIEGTDQFPTSGEDAIAPGKSGDAGSPGALTTNSPLLIDLADCSPGTPGTAPAYCHGGARGYPDYCAFYEMKLYFDNLNRDNSSGSRINDTERRTSDGKSHSGVGGKPASAKPPRLLGAAEAPANIWIHPSLVHTALAYVRRAYLSEDRDGARSVLEALDGDKALGGRRPDGAWTDEMSARWASAGMEVATLRQRLEAGLDYFGKPAGHMPLLSLSGSLELYRMQTKTALRMFMLAMWVRQRADKAGDAAKAFTDAIKVLDGENGGLAKDIQQNEMEASSLAGRIDDLAVAQDKLVSKLGALRAKLYAEAHTTAAQKAHIKLAVNTAAALCQVIPVGQPILGSVGTLAASATDLLDAESLSDEKAWDALKEKGKEAVEKYKQAQTDAKTLIADAKKAAKEEAKEQGNKLTPEDYTKLAKTKASAWSTVGAGLAPAASHLTTAYKNMTVPQAVVDAEIEKLAAKNEEWKALTTEIKDLQQQRGAVVGDLIRLTQKVGESYARLTSNTDAVYQMRDEVSRNQAKLSPQAVQTVSSMQEAAYLSLIRSLYDVVRAYESTMLKSVSVDWSLDSLLGGVVKLIKDDKDWTEANVTGFVQALEPLFDQARENIRDTLRNDLKTLTEKTHEKELVISSAADLAVINNKGRLSLDPLLRELIRPTWERAMLAKIELTEITFEGPEPTAGDVEIIVRLAPTGVVRSGQQLFGLRQEAEVSHTFSYSFRKKKPVSDPVSATSVDLLNFLTGDQGGAVRAKLARSPAWTDMTVVVDYSGLGASDPTPSVKSLVFNCAIDAVDAPSKETVLEVHSNYAGAVFSCDRIRGEAAGELYAVFTNGPSVTLTAAASADDPDWVFESWLINEGARRRTVSEPKVELKLDRNVRAECRYKRMETA